MNIFEDEVIKKIKQSIPSLIDIYEDFQEGNTVFQFSNNELEINDSFIESASDKEFIDFLKALRVPVKKLKANSVSEQKIIIHTHVLGLNQRYTHSQVEELPQVMQERAKAEQWLKKARSSAKRHSTVEQVDTFHTSKGQIGQIKKQIENLRVLLADNTDRVSQNKWGENVYTRDIIFENKVVGSMEYLEDEKAVTILRTDVEKEYQGQGIGFNAYKAFIFDKASRGKEVGSDSILSEQAQRVYEKLGDEVLYMVESPTYFLNRGNITSIEREDRIRQRRDVPTEYVDGAIVSAGGYRMKGESIYTILPSATPNPSPVIRIEDHDLSTGDTYNLTITPSYIEKSIIEGNANILSEDAYKEIEELLFAASSELTHPENESIAKSLTMENVLVWRIDRISYENLVELNNKLNPTLNNGISKSY